MGRGHYDRTDVLVYTVHSSAVPQSPFHCPVETKTKFMAIPANDIHCLWTGFSKVVQEKLISVRDNVERYYG